MANYENYLTVIGSKRQLPRFDRTLTREMAHAEEQRQIPFKNTAELPRCFHRYANRPCFKGYKFFTCFLPVAYVRRLSRRFPALVFNLTFDIDRDVWDEGFEKTGFEKSGDFTLKNGETVCGYFTFEPVNRYPAWDYDPEPVENQISTKEAA